MPKACGCDHGVGEHQYQKAFGSSRQRKQPPPEDQRRGDDGCDQQNVLDMGRKP